MLTGHGDDLFRYPHIRVNFSSNVYNHFNHEALFHHLAAAMQCVTNYPEPTPHSLEADLAATMLLSPDEVVATNGATEAIYLLAQTWRGFRTAILAPTFSEYADACRLHQHQVTHIHSLAQQDAGTQMVWLCNPNNPTGQVLDRDTLLAHICAHPHTLFVIDASYAPFTTRSLPSPRECAALPNVLMLHSMTKEYAIPGLRLGFLTGAAELLQRIRQQRMPWSVNSLAIAAGRYLLRHRADYQLPLTELLDERQRLADAFALLGIHTWPSDTHILLCRHPHLTAAALKECLAHQHSLLIRDASNFQSLDEHCFRIAVQNQEENELLLQALRTV